MQTRHLAGIGTIVVAIALSQPLVVGGAAERDSDAVEIAFVANSLSGTVTLVDVVARAVIGSIDINPERALSRGPNPPNYVQDTDVSPDGRTLYVSRGYIADVAAFDIGSARMSWSRPLNSPPLADHMTLTADGRSLFVSASWHDRVYRIATATGEITGHLETDGAYPHDNRVSRDGRRLYNTSIAPFPSRLPRSTPPTAETPGNSFQLTVADAETMETTDRIKLGKRVDPWQFTPDEKGIYAQLAMEHAVVAFDLASGRITRRLDLPVKPGVTHADFDDSAPHHGLALTDDGRTLCLAGRASDYAALVHAPELTLIATIPVGDAPGWAETADAGRLCLIANNRSDDLSIISIADHTEIRRVLVGDGPKHITVARIPAAVVEAVKSRR